MVRLIGILIGFGFVVVAAISLITGVFTFFTTEHVEDAAHALHEEPRDFSFRHDGPFGQWDRQQLQRGFLVYRDVCASCHGLNLVAFRNLTEIGYSEAAVRAIADQWPIQVPSINPDTGEPASRKALPADRFPSPYANEVAARAANNNALPPDLSLIVKARHGGANYIASLLTGYRDAATYRDHENHPVPADIRPGQGLYFNPTFPNINIAMPPPLNEGQVTYSDGTRATADQMAQDVAAFLTWTAEPNLQTRHRAGTAVLIFLLFASILAWFAYKNVWATAKRTVRIAGPLDPENMARSTAAKDDAGIAG